MEGAAAIAQKYTIGGAVVGALSSSALVKFRAGGAMTVGAMCAVGALAGGVCNFNFV